MVEGEREGHHRAGEDSTVAHDGLFLQPANGENGRLWIVDNGGAATAAEAADVVEREGAAAQFGQRERAFARPLDQMLKPGGDLYERQAVGVAQDGNQQALRRVGSNANMVRTLIDNLARSSSRLALKMGNSLSTGISSLTSSGM